DVAEPVLVAMNAQHTLSEDVGPRGIVAVEGVVVVDGENDALAGNGIEGRTDVQNDAILEGFEARAKLRAHFTLPSGIAPEPLCEPTHLCPPLDRPWCEVDMPS